MTAAGGIGAPEPIESHHIVDGFRCGSEALDGWLAMHALQDHRANASRTKVICRDGTVVGFYSLAAGSVAPDEAPDRVRKGLARHPVPVVLLTRLAVDLSEQGSGLGTRLFRNALRTVAEVADPVGIRALLVHAKSDEAKRWYEARARFAPSPVNEREIYLLLKDLRATLVAQ